jgi:hypothetical protein
MTAIDGTAGGTPAWRPEPSRAGPDPGEDPGEEDVARAAARDVARLLDRRGLRDVVALARRVLRESAWSGALGPRVGEPGGTLCTLREHERSTRRGAAGRAVDDDRA